MGIKNFQVVSWLAMAFAALPVLADESGTSLTYGILENGHVTIAINDAGGRRVRNLFADVEQKKGTHTGHWGGLDDAGQVVPPGEYRWVGLVRGALHAVYRGQFSQGNPPWLYGKTGGWLADHYCPARWSATRTTCLSDRASRNGDTGWCAAISMARRCGEFAG